MTHVLRMSFLKKVITVASARDAQEFDDFLESCAKAAVEALRKAADALMPYHGTAKKMLNLDKFGVFIWDLFAVFGA